MPPAWRSLMPYPGFGSPHRYRQKRARGVVLIAVMLILTLTAGSLLLTYLNQLSSARQQRVVHDTARALTVAKQALIGYAVTYPDSDRLAGGPGFLPCPDTNNSGSPNPPCGIESTGRLPIGRLPWRYLGLDDLRDGAGERLWYALSWNFRNNPKKTPLNSDREGQLCVDGNHDGDCTSADATDLVAVLLAPGVALQSQERAGDANTPANYLEDVNASFTDVRYRRASSAEIADTDAVAGRFNDRLVTLKRRDLMAVIERRVLKEVQLALRAYADSYGSDADSDGDGDTFLWLAPFDNSSTATYRSQVGQHVGQIAFHHPDQPPFATDFTLDLRLAEHLAASFSGTVSSAHLTTATISFAASDGSVCRWQDARSVDCSARSSVVEGSDAAPYPAVWRERLWVLDQVMFSSTPSYTAPTASDVRRRNVSTTDPGGATLSLSISDTFYRRACDTCGATAAYAGSGEIDLPGTLGAAGTLAVRGIHADLAVHADTDPEIPGGELPEWFVSNHWHHLIYVAIAAANAPGGSGRCTPPSCLSLSARSGAADDTIQALAVIAGPALPLQSRPSSRLGDYFEGANQDSDASAFAALRHSATFNDNVLVIGP